MVLIDCAIVIPTIMTFFSVIMNWAENVTICNVIILLVSMVISVSYEKSKSRSDIHENLISVIVVMGFGAYIACASVSWGGLSNGNKESLIALGVIVLLQYLVAIYVRHRKRLR